MDSSLVSPFKETMATQVQEEKEPTIGQEEVT